MILTKTDAHRYTDAESGNLFYVSGGGSAWRARTTVQGVGLADLSGEFATQSEAEAALTQFALSAGFIDLT